jgi:hypothetical protein
MILQMIQKNTSTGKPIFDLAAQKLILLFRVGRTARGVDGSGKALMFLLPSELMFLKYLKELKIPLEEYEFPKNKIANIQAQVRLMPQVGSKHATFLSFLVLTCVLVRKISCNNLLFKPICQRRI